MTAQNGGRLITEMEIGGTKRKVPQEASTNPKRLRGSTSPKTYEDDISSVVDEDLALSDSDEELGNHKGTATPLTPQSYASPRYPSNVKTIPCTFDGCDKLFNRQAKLIQHLRSHTDTRPFICPHTPCAKAYLRDSHLQHHIKSAHSHTRDYVCTWKGCDKAFTTGTRFRRHVGTHAGNTKTCTVDGCGQVFRKHSTMEAHVRKVHEGIMPHICQFTGENAQMCAMGFDTSAQLRSHEGRMHSRNTFECTVCDSDQDGVVPPAFPTYSALQEHVKIDHPPTCEQCGLACTSKSALKSHIEVKHGGTSLDERRKFYCPEPECSRGFTKKGNMNAHVQSSHRHKRYVCGSVLLAHLKNVNGWDGTLACGVDFATKATLEEHIRIVHMGLESREHRRRQKTIRKSKKTNGAVRITGADNDLVLCTILGCKDEFPTTFELASHLQVRHGVADVDVQAKIPALEEPKTVFARPGFLGSTAFVNREDLDAEAAFDMQVGNDPDLYLNLEENEDPFHGENFWLGGATGYRGNNADEWIYDEQEMRRLINVDLYGLEDTEEKAADHDTMDIDPMLS